MPASVAAANPTTVLPYFLAVAFQREQAWGVDQNLYRGGEVQSTVLVANNRKTWAITSRLTPAQMAALEAYYVARGGGLQEFWFYDLWETVPPLTEAGYDETGSSVDGRYAVRFEGSLQVTLQMGRSQAGLVLKEVS